MAQNMDSTSSNIKEPIKRLRFTADDDLALLREVVACCPKPTGS